MSAWDRMRLAADVLVRGPVGSPARRERAFLPATSPLTTEQGHQARTEAALRMMDEDCYGFLLVTVHREKVGVCGEVRMLQHIHPTWWPAIVQTLDRLSEAVMDMVSDE